MSFVKSFFLSVALLGPVVAQADHPVVTDAKASKSGDTWTVSVALLHPDTGWDHYADGWEVLDENGDRIGMRVLAHPHVNEQPFTRSLSGVIVPTGQTRIGIRARCLVDGWGDDITWIDLTK